MDKQGGSSDEAVKNALDFGVFDEDLYQELCHTLLLCILKFRI